MLPLDVVKEANKNPYNHRAGVSKPYDLHYSGNECQMIIGSNSFITKDPGNGTISVPITIDGIPILAFVLSKGRLHLNLNLFDEFNSPILRIMNNQLLFVPTPWDIELVGRNLIIREAKGEFLVDIIFEVPNKVIINRGRFLLNGVEILIYPDYLLLTNNKGRVSGIESRNFSPFGFVFGENNLPAMCIMQFHPIPRYFGDRSEAIKWAKKSFEDSNPVIST